MADCWNVYTNKSPLSRETERLRALQKLNNLSYPLADLSSHVIEDALRYFLMSPELMDEFEVLALAQLVLTVITRQHVILNSSLSSELLHFMMLHVLSISDPTELLYTGAELVEQTQPTTEVLSELLSMTGPLATLLTKPNIPTSSKRGSLRCIAVLCCNPNTPQSLLHDLLTLVTTLLMNMKEQNQLCDGSKYLLSLVKTLHSLLLSLASLRSFELMSALLTTLKCYMCIGLHNLCDPKAAQTFVPHQLSALQKKLCRAVPTAACVKNGETVCVTPYSSDSEFSDSSEPVAEKADLTNSRIRQQVFSCLAVIFQSLDHQSTFSYCQSFLPNPLQQKSLLFCVLKDPSSKCRSAAVTAITLMLAGSKPYLAPAKDGLLTSQPYTPYSYSLGSMLQELHWGILLAVATEANSLTLTQIVKCLSTLVMNTPYHQLSGGYISGILSTLQPLLNHRDIDVQVAALTCQGSVFSLSPQHHEVLQWLGTPPANVVGHCSELLSSSGCATAIKTEALQVLTSLTKFYFSAVKHKWEDIGQLYFTHLVFTQSSLQLHVLKLLEELCRALAVSTEIEIKDIVRFWNQLLTGPLPQILQDATTQSLCSQGCSLLSTMGNHVLSRLGAGMRTLVLTLPLGLCKESSLHHHSVCASAVRVLGVFVAYECLKSDLHFIVDCHSTILHCLSCSSVLVRVQASWSLGNLTDVLSNLNDVPLALLSPLFGAIHAAMLDNEKVRCNAIRACGNLLRCINKTALVTYREQVKDLCTLLSKAVVNGGMKCRWNACYASHSVFLNHTLVEQCADDMDLLIKSLCSAVHQCKNFKVRINSALALGTPHQFSSSQFRAVWSAMMYGLENSEDEIDFSEYKHALTLKSQLCNTVIHLITVMKPDHFKGSGLHLPVEQLRNTLTEFLKREKLLPEVLHKVEDNLKILNGCSGIDILCSVFATVQITEESAVSLRLIN